MKIAILVCFGFLIFSVFAIDSKAQFDIRKVDFRNFTYKLSCGDADGISLVRVKNGEYYGIKAGTKVYLNIYEIKFGDLNGDGKDEAVVLYMCGSGASYAYFRGLIFSMKNRKPVMATEIEGGNKGDGGFHEVRIVKNHLIVERYELGVAGSPCCPVSIETTRYRLKGKGLVQIGKPILRKIPATS